MLIDTIRNLIAEHIGNDAITAEEPMGLQHVFVIKPSFIKEVCLLLRDHEQTWFDFLSCLSGIDDGIQAGTFTVVYHLASIPYKTQLTLKVVVPNERGHSLPCVPSVCSIWRTADWHEREAFDLVGIFFDGHPDLRRILLPDDWEGYPLRKDYQEAEIYHGISIK